MKSSELWRKYKFWVTSPLFSLALGIVLFLLNNANLLISGIILTLSIILPALIILFKEWRVRKNQVLNIWGSETQLDVVIRILNEKGDASLHSRIKITNRDNNPIKFISKDIYSTSGTNIDLSSPKVVDSSPKGIQIIERSKYNYSKDVHINNNVETHQFVECDYRLEPPLMNNTNFIVYDLDVDALEYAKDITSDKGVIDGYIVKNVSLCTKIIVISPNKWEIELLDYWVENNQANRVEYLKSIIKKPILNTNHNQLNWEINYPKLNHLYLFRYRIKGRRN